MGSTGMSVNPTWGEVVLLDGRVESEVVSASHAGAQGGISRTRKGA